MLNDVFITGLGKFLPGDPIPNERMEDYLGRIHGKPSRARRRILEQNQIRTRHYAIDTEQRSLFRNSEMAALAVRDALGHGRVPLESVDFLAAASTQGDLCVPGFASMVHGELKNPPCELASLHGVCASGMMALKNAFLQVQAGEKQVALACASEFPSRLFKASRYEGQGGIAEGKGLPFDVEFLRWMLSDGAGAALLQPAPNPKGLSLKVEWISNTSHANTLDVCMYSGANKGEDAQLGASWLDFPSFEAAAREGALNLKQDIRLLDKMVQLGVSGWFDLVERGMADPKTIDWVICHYSSHFFRGRIFELLEKGGMMVPEDRWFTNLYTKGNVGSASVYVMLEELFNEGKLKPGQKIFLMVPESGRFITAYALLTVVGEQVGHDPATLKHPELVEGPPPRAPLAPELRLSDDPLQQSLIRQLTRVWLDFEAQLSTVPLIARLETGRFSLEDYRAFLLDWRQQVIEGSRWIARAASSLTLEHFPLRALFIQHARDEGRDYQMLERDFVSVGGAPERILTTPKNLGSEALSAWMFHRASQENPLDLLGAMFIIEGLGNRLALRWGQAIRDQLSLRDDQVSFLLYHGANDPTHFEKLEHALGSGILTPEVVERIVKTAKVTARLYRLQLEELGNT